MVMRTKFSQLPALPSFSKELKADDNLLNRPRQVFEAHFSWVETMQPTHPEWIHFSKAFWNELDLEGADDKLTLKVLSGAEPFPDFRAFAMCYGGHQFGHWAGQLGDGRATHILETEIKGQPWALQLKGAGPTPYSRSADGLAVLRSSIREYLCSEAMHALGVPTSRALSLIKTGNWVTRDMLYDGHPKQEPGAIVCRMAPTFIRFGNFEIFSARGDKEALKKLVDFTLETYFLHLGAPSKESYLAFFQEVVNSTLDMIVHWQRVGFVHGVMNTDNMSILGLTIDYGPYGWLEDYDPTWTPNTTDREHRRYRFENQPNMALWNLIQLANALFPLIEEVKPLENILESFKSDYSAAYHKMMCGKLGLQDNDNVSDFFIEELTQLLSDTQVDLTNFFRGISEQDFSDYSLFTKHLETCSYLENQLHPTFLDKWKKWHVQWETYRMKENWDSEKRLAAMQQVNPKYVLRNYMAQLAIDAAEKGDYRLVDELYELLQQPYADQPEKNQWAAKRPEWAKNKVGCSMLSCSS